MIAIGCDHGGFELKNHVMKHLEKSGREFKDFGCFEEKRMTLQPSAIFIFAVEVFAVEQKQRR